MLTQYIPGLIISLSLSWTYSCVDLEAEEILQQSQYFGKQGKDNLSF